MNETEARIKELVNSNGKSADKMAQTLKSIGEGSMEKGISIVSKHYENHGFLKGTLVGTGTTLTVVTLLFIFKKLAKTTIKKHKAMKEQGSKILSALEDELDNNLLDDKITSEIEEED